MSSTTFDAQLDVASRVAQESPELYYEIQSLNDYGAESLEALAKAVERIRTAVLSQDHDAFVALMQRGRDYLEDRRSVTERAPELQGACTRMLQSDAPTADRVAGERTPRRARHGPGRREPPAARRGSRS